ncbi:MAG: thioredoxin domain-containing protein [Polyangia bacterium]
MLTTLRPATTRRRLPLLSLLSLVFGVLSCRPARQDPPVTAAPPPTVLATAPASTLSIAELAAQHGTIIDPALERFQVAVGSAATTGPKTARITLIGFTDYQCPFCARVEPTLAQLRERYGKDLRIALKHNPLPFHPEAAPAARAALAARMQGEDKFWLYHRRLFENQARLGAESYDELARELGLDFPRWKLDLARNRDRYDELIKGDQLEAAKVGARGTPSFFINGRPLAGAQPLAAFEQVIDDELARAARLEQAGVRPEQLYAVLQHGAKVAPPAPQPPPFKLPDPAVVYRIPVGKAPVRGPATAAVTIIEYADFECPFCSRVNPTLDRLRDQFGNSVRIAFKHLPLTFHPHAQLAAEAAVAAHEQGRFFALHDKLFASQQALDRDAIEGYAVELGLDLKRFRAALDSGRARKQVAADVAEAQRFGARGTPTFFINGKPVNGAQPYENFEKIVRSELQLAEAKLRAGVPPGQIYEAMIREGRDRVPSPPPSAAERILYKVPLGDAPVRGPRDAKVTVVMWTDFQCPFCGRVSETLNELVKLYPRDVRIAVKHLPLSLHDKARQAAEASLAAKEQGRFWPFHDLLFKNQDALDRPSLERFAKEAGMDVARFAAALDSGRFRKPVDDDIAEAGRLGVSGTPAFFINGRSLSGAQPLARFRERIDEARQEAEALLRKRRVPAGRLYAELTKDGLERATPSGGDSDSDSDGDGAGAGEVDDHRVYKIAPGDGPSLGPKDAPVTLIAFSDFQCPFCGRVVPTLKRIHERFAGRVRVVFRNYPLPFHKDAWVAAEAALAAHSQGRFWPMHDKLFENQAALDRASLERYAQELGLDLSRFKADLDSRRFRAAVQADIDAVRSLPDGVGAGFGTPTFFINGRKLVGAYPYERFEELINEALRDKAKAPK